MNSPPEPDLKAALHKLSDVAGPPDLSGAALRGAQGVRRRRAVFTSLAAVTAVAALSLPFVVADRPTAESPQFAAPQPDLGDCEEAPTIVPDPQNYSEEVTKEHWPPYVITVLGLLPARNDYVVQNARDLCNFGDASASNAYTVINLGRLREFGHLTLDLYVHETVEWIPRSCTELNTIVTNEQVTIMFCEEATDTQPMLYGLEYTADAVTVGAIYPDHRAVVMGRHEAAAVPAISVDDMKRVVSHQDLLSLIPVAAQPLPTRSPEGPGFVQMSPNATPLPPTTTTPLPPTATPLPATPTP